MLKKLYEKSEICFAIVWIIAYVILASVGDNLSSVLGIEKVVTLPILLVLSFILIFFIKKYDFSKKYGLCKPKTSASCMLFYLPLIVLISANLWYGVALNFTIIETILYVLSMFCVGFLEELIFRGFLFNAMAKNGVKSAVIVSSVTFGIGHIVNLINGSGAELLPNILQVIYAMAVGFTFVLIYYKTDSLIPCIITHSLFNSLSAFANEGVMSIERQIFSGILITIISVGYALYVALAVKIKKKEI